MLCYTNPAALKQYRSWGMCYEAHLTKQNLIPLFFPFLLFETFPYSIFWYAANMRYLPNIIVLNVRSLSSIWRISSTTVFRLLCYSTRISHRRLSAPYQTCAQHLSLLSFLSSLRLPQVKLPRQFCFLSSWAKRRILTL